MVDDEFTSAVDWNAAGRSGSCVVMRVCSRRRGRAQQEVILTEEFRPPIAVALATVVMLEPFTVRHRHRVVDERLVTTVATVPRGRPFDGGGENLIIRLRSRCGTKQHEVVLEVFALINLGRGFFDNATCRRKGVNGVLKLVEHHRVIFDHRRVEHDRNFELAEASLSCLGESNLVAGRIHTSRTSKHR